MREPRLLSLASGFAKALDGNKLHHAARRGNRAGTSQDGHCPHKACAVDAEKFGEFRLRHAEFFIAPELSLRRILKEEQKNGRQSRDRFRKREAARCKDVNFQRFPTLDAKKLVNAPKMSAHHRGICHF